MPSLKKLSMIDPETKYVVYGWIREAEKELQLNYIPLRIRSLCLLYLHEDDVFEMIKNYDWKNVSENRKILKGKNLMLSSLNRYVYGETLISSSSENRCKWVLRINELQKNGGAFMGISSCDENNGLDVHRYMMDHYGDKCDWFYWLNYGIRRIKRNDEICIWLNLRKAKVYICLNHHWSQGVIYKNITTGKGINYRLSVSITGSIEIEILSFKTM